MLEGSILINMRLKYLKWLDRYIGIAACLFFSALRRMVSLGGKARASECITVDDPRILIIKLWGFGSITLAFDFFTLLRAKYPKARIYAVTLKQNRAIYELTGLFDEIITIDIKKLSSFIPGLLKSLGFMARSRFDVAFDLEFTSRFSAIFTYFSRARCRLGFRYEGIYRGNLYTHTIPFDEKKKLRDSFIDLALLIADKDKPAEKLSLKISALHKESVNSILSHEGLGNCRPLIGINVNASELCLLRRWPKEYFANLTQELIKRYAAHIIFIGDRGDSGYVRSVTEGILPRSNVHDFSGKTSLSELFYLFATLDLFISNDSGPLHLAVYAGVPTISFFGPETPLIYGPDRDSDIVFYKGLACSPCIRIKNYKLTTCRNNQRCLKEIFPQEVIDAIERKQLLRQYRRKI